MSEETLSSAVDNAAASLSNTEDAVTETTTTETTAAKLIHGLTEDELPNAAQIFQALKDPAKAQVFVKFLAENNGYVLKDNGDQSSKETTEATVVDMLREQLGEDFAPFADKLGPAIEKIVSSQVEKATKPINERLKSQDELSTQQQVTNILTDFGKENFTDGKIPDKVIGEMKNLMGQFTPAQGVEQKAYIGNLLKMAMGNLNIAPKSSRTARTANDPLAFLGNDATSKPSNGTDVAPKKMSIDEAVMEAAKSLSSKSN